MNIHKAQLRTSLKAKRQTLSGEQQQQAAFALTNHLIAHPLFKQNQHFAFYVAANGEMDTALLLKACFAAGKNCYLPVLPPAPAKALAFMPFHENDNLINNRFGIKEPALDEHKIMAANCLDVVFMPLVAFDAKGNRIGMGAGYYDTTFAFLRITQPKPMQPLLIGLAYSFQEMVQLPRDLWDVPLDGVATEKGVDIF